MQSWNFFYVHACHALTGEELQFHIDHGWYVFWFEINWYQQYQPAYDKKSFMSFGVIHDAHDDVMAV